MVWLFLVCTKLRACILLTLWNEILADFTGQKGYKFNPRQWCCDEAGANFVALYGVYGIEAASEKVTTCILHYGKSILKYKKYIPEKEKKLFKKLARKLETVGTIDAYSEVKARLWHLCKNHKKTRNWCQWWHSRRAHLFQAFKGSAYSGSNVAEIGNAMWVRGKPLTLIDAAFDDMATIICLEQEVKKYMEGKSRVTGKAPTERDIVAKEHSKQLKRAKEMGKSLKSIEAMKMHASEVRTPSIFLPSNAARHRPSHDNSIQGRFLSQKSSQGSQGSQSSFHSEFVGDKEMYDEESDDQEQGSSGEDSDLSADDSNAQQLDKYEEQEEEDEQEEEEEWRKVEPESKDHSITSRHSLLQAGSSSSSSDEENVSTDMNRLEKKSKPRKKGTSSQRTPQRKKKREEIPEDSYDALLLPSSYPWPWKSKKASGRSIPTETEITEKMEEMKTYLKQPVSYTVTELSKRKEDLPQHPVEVLIAPKSVSRCQGCKKKISEDQKEKSKNLVFKQMNYTQWGRSEMPDSFQSCYMHLKLSCMQALDGNNRPNHLIVKDQDFIDLMPEQIQHLSATGLLPYILANRM